MYERVPSFQDLVTVHFTHSAYFRYSAPDRMPLRHSEVTRNTEAWGTVAHFGFKYFRQRSRPWMQLCALSDMFIVHIWYRVHFRPTVAALSPWHLSLVPTEWAEAEALTSQYSTVSSESIPVKDGHSLLLDRASYSEPLSSDSCSETKKFMEIIQGAAS
jgi:hypothetical protein